MKRTATGACVAALFGFAISVGAQTPTPPSPTSQTPRPMSSDKSDKDISVTGCVAKSADGSYTLTNARIDPAGSASTSTGSSTSTTAGTTGTSGSTSPAGSSSASGTTWALSGSSSDLDKHVGHKVQVMGKEATPSASGTSGSSSSTATSSSSSSMTANQKLDVSSVKMVAMSCS
jgi:hypothetical protein